MGTLNQYAARVANMIGQPDNQELKERVKDMIKTGFANRIRQSTERNGIDNILKLSFIATVEEKEFKDIHPSQYKVVEGKPVLCTSNKIPVPVRIKNDAPFTFVGTVNGIPFRYSSSPVERRFHPICSPTGTLAGYYLDNGYIIVDYPRANGEVDNRNKLNEILITGIWENPEEVITMFDNEDGQDVELPFPNDMLENIIAEILKTEFNIFPQDKDIVTNKPVIQAK
jgi:hypothetical protein